MTVLGTSLPARLVCLFVLANFAWHGRACAGEAAAEYGPYGPQSPRMREQLWVLPSGTPGMALRATVFRPADEAPNPLGAGAAQRPLVVINHGTSEATRHSVSLPVYYWLSRWFVERGYVVLLPQRRGHGATGGELVEARDNCAAPDHLASGRTAADDVEAAVRFMTAQPFVAPRGAVVVGISTGGWASLALASRNLPQVRAVVNFAGGRGGHAWGQPGKVCGEGRLVAAAARLGHDAAIPTLWLYSRNDTYFGPGLAEVMARAWKTSGGSAELHLLPAYGADGHTIADDQDGWELWGRQLDAFLTRTQAGVTLSARAQARDLPAAPGGGSATGQ